MKDTGQEDNWFKKHEKLMLKEAASKREKRLQSAAAKLGLEKLDEVRQAHWLKCPKCGHDMEQVTLEGIEIESCTFCEGIYFDRGEFESLLLRKTPQRFVFFRKFFDLD